MDNSFDMLVDTIYDFYSILSVPELIDSILQYDTFDMLNIRYCCKQLREIYDFILNRTIKNGNITYGYKLSYHVSSYYLYLSNRYSLDSTTQMKIDSQYFPVQVHVLDNETAKRLDANIGGDYKWYRIDISKRIQDGSSIQLVLQDGYSYESSFFSYNDDKIINWNVPMESNEITLSTCRGTITKVNESSRRIYAHNIICVSDVSHVFPLSRLKRECTLNVYYSFIKARY